MKNALLGVWVYPTDWYDDRGVRAPHDGFVSIHAAHVGCLGGGSVRWVHRVVTMGVTTTVDAATIALGWIAY